jgi:hypothetical protein
MTRAARPSAAAASPTVVGVALDDGVAARMKA